MSSAAKDRTLDTTCAQLAAELIEQVRVFRHAQVPFDSDTCVGYVLPKSKLSNTFYFCKVSVGWNNELMKFKALCTPVPNDVDVDTTFANIVDDCAQQINKQSTWWMQWSDDDSGTAVERPTPYVCRLTQQELQAYEAEQQMPSRDGMVLKTKHHYLKKSKTRDLYPVEQEIIMFCEDNDFAVLTMRATEAQRDAGLRCYPAHQPLKRASFMSEPQLLWSAVGAIQKLHRCRIAHMDVRFPNMVLRQNDGCVMLIDLDRAVSNCKMAVPDAGAYKPSIWYLSATSDAAQSLRRKSWSAEQLDWFQLGLSILNVGTNDASITIDHVEEVANRLKDENTKRFIHALLQGTDLRVA